MPGLLDKLRSHFGDCVTRFCRDQGCSLSLDSIKRSRRVIIHGTRFQKTRRFNKKLCDRIIFLQLGGLFLVATELTTEKKINLIVKTEQIQNGLLVAEQIVGDQGLKDWWPLLVLSRLPDPRSSAESKYLRTHPVSFHDTKKVIYTAQCHSSLRELIKTYTSK